MSYEPTVFCRDCEEALDVWAEWDNRWCEPCMEFRKAASE